LTTNYTYNKEVSKSYRKILAENNWKVVSDTNHENGTTEYGVVLSEIRAKDPDVVFFSTVFPTEAVAFMNQFLIQPTESLVYIQYCPNIPEFRKLLGPKANGVLWQTLIGWLPTKEGLAWVERYKKRFGVDPGYTAACNTYDSIYMWAEAVKAVGDPKNHKKVNEYILNNTYTGIGGTYKYNPKIQETIAGNVGEGIPNQFFQIQNGEQVLLVLGTESTGAKFELPPWLKK
jgi:branched-chain amino acid transport system substrate-binding protein